LAALVTSVEIPYSIAAALPSLAVIDITNEVAQEVGEAEMASGIAYVSSGVDSLVRVNEREAGFFHDLEAFLQRLVPEDTDARERLLAMVLGPRTEQIPFANRRLCLGRWQRIMLFSFDESCRADWTLTLLG
jgi:thiamine phosphate synthase YjbQ (UPF0047 family)